MQILVSTLLSKRGITGASAVSAFLNPDYERHTHSPFLLLGMDRAVARLLLAISQNERIAVYADFDCDGIPGAALLSDFLKKIGYENFEVYLPHRDREGYGFHTDAIAALAARDVKLIITVDVGTTALDAVHFAKEKGVDVIITDHHEVTGALPEAVVVLNPKLGDYPFPHLCGAAVAFKLVQATLTEGKRLSLQAFKNIPDGWEKWLLDMVAIATIADMVPLVGENRVLAHWGLIVLRKSPRHGITALCAKLRLRKSELTEDDIGFSIAPRINAASRMDEPMLALRLLTTGDSDEAKQLAAQLEKLNASRKGVVAGMVKQARSHVKQRFGESDRVIVLGNPEWKPALLGLAANSIMNERGGVVCLWGRDTLGRIKGSCRSDGDVSLTELFANAGDVFEESGGHKASGGFTVSHERVHTLPEILAAASSMLATVPSVAEASAHDALVTLSEVTSALFAEVSKLAPFGAGNPKPVFLVRGAIVTGMQRFGKEKAHLELLLECRESGVRCRAFDFFRSPEDSTHLPVQGEEAGVLATIARDSYRGGLALRIVDVVPVSV
ncbi:MAG: single-stranded-DNA-specific exonuclease RecJ [bacterium]|nr:single-stranded-DNA-specific exonuclease RecJ [bacterium]